MSFTKSFTEWFKTKPGLDQDKIRPLFKEREIWMSHVGTNIGFELDGKNIESLRPVIVFKKLSTNTFLAIPLTSRLKNGNWYSPSFVNNQEGRYCLNQIRMIDSKRLKYRIGQIDSNDYHKLKKDFFGLFDYEA